MPGHPDARVRRRRRPRRRAGALAGARVPAPRLGRADPAAPFPRGSAPRRHRGGRAGPAAAGGAGPGPDAPALAPAAARHAGRHPQPPAGASRCGYALAGTPSATCARACGWPACTRLEALAQTLAVARRCGFAGRAALRVSGRDRAAGPHARHLPAPGDAGRRRAPLPQGVPEAIATQIEKELGLIRDLQYEAYFLTVTTSSSSRAARASCARAGARPPTRPSATAWASPRSTRYAATRCSSASSARSATNRPTSTWTSSTSAARK